MAANKVHWWDAPKGYKAILQINKTYPCYGCLFYEADYNLCLESKCASSRRKDKQDVIFVKRDNNNKK